MSPIDITAIIPAYNVGKYIGDALESVLRQDPPFSRVIVIDDGSTDNTRNVVESFGASRILYHYQDNQGLGPARNSGIELCDGEYMYFMDGDDILVDGLTKFIEQKISESKQPIDALLFSAIDFDDRTGNRLASSDYFNRGISGTFRSGQSALVASLQHRHLPACVWLCVFRRTAIEGVYRLRFKNILHEDEIFTPALLMNCGVTVVSGNILYRRRVRENSIMTTAVSEKNVCGCLCIARWWWDQAISTQDRNLSRLFAVRSHYFYGRSMLAAGRSNIKLSSIRQMVRDLAPHFLWLTTIDYFLNLISRRFSFRLSIMRANIFSILRLRL